MKAEKLQDLARAGRLYPAVILYGHSAEERQRQAVELARTLLCAAPAEERPCGSCRACTRIAWPDGKGKGFHPDFHVLTRDLANVTSADAARGFLQGAYQAPFEARGQVFVIAEADTLSPGAADSLLKILEEPPRRSPRHFLLLAATRRDLLPTLRSRSLAVYLGAAEKLDEERVEAVAARFGSAVDRYVESRAAVYLLLAAEALGEAGDFADPRARRPWATAAAAVLRHVRGGALPADRRRSLCELAAALLDAPRWRQRAIPHGRVLDGLLARHLGG